LVNKRVLFVITEDWAVISHRLHLIDSAIASGYQVGLATRTTKYYNKLVSRGIKVFHWNLERKSLNPIKEIIVLLRLCQILWDFRPDIIHAVAQKPLIYSGLARKLFSKAVFIGTLGGVGFIFTSKSLKARLLKPFIKFFLKISLSGDNSRLILQNKANVDLVKKINIINNRKIKLIKGAGVETDKFVPSKIPNKLPIVILPGRMLWDKGIGEFVRVAKRLNKRKIIARFVLVGDVDLHNPETVSQKEIDKWVVSGIIEHWKRRDDMEKVYKKTSIVCLPSYSEGLPKVLLEAGSCARPTIAFDVPGCNEVIKNRVNGLLIEFKNEKALEIALAELIENKSLCEKLGKEGRKIVEKEFSSSIINSKTFNVWNELFH